MRLFGSKDPQRYFEGTGFTVTRTIFDPPLLMLAPAVYDDEPARAWAVRMPGAEPRVFSYDDVLACEVADDDGSAALEQVEGTASKLEQLVTNPALVSRANAARRGDMCFGLGIVVAVRGIEGTPLQLPLITRPTRRSSVVYRRLRDVADEVKRDFDRMAAGTAGPGEEEVTGTTGSPTKPSDGDVAGRKTGEA